MRLSALPGHDPKQAAKRGEFSFLRASIWWACNAPKALWINYNNKALLPAVDAGTAALFDQGHQVGHWAKKLFPAGKDLGHIAGFEEPVEATRRALDKRKPIFEASFIYNSCFSRADVLAPTEDGRWDIIEVKSSGAPEKIEDLRPDYLHYLQDLAFQRYVYEGAGLGIRNCYLLLVNKNYVRSGAIDPQRTVDANRRNAAGQRHRAESPCEGRRTQSRSGFTTMSRRQSLTSLHRAT